ncbi:MAG TPA: exonuclease SbcCD subunit D [Gemmatimonadota bacterium]|nr:exonuclease SbcCD subunit D [Gemmatimonadota bacterium]
MSVRVLHLADVHLGATLANFGDYAGRRRSELEEAFRRSIDVALARRVHLVLIAGDLFDTFRPDPATVNLVRRELGRLREAGIMALAVPGTHDSLAWGDCVYRRETLPFHRLFTEPTFGDPATLEIGGAPVVVYGIAFDPRRSGRGWDTLRRVRPDGIHLAVVHAACRFNPAWPIGPEDLPFREDELAAFGMDYVALGHYHNTRVFEDGGRVIGAYSGSVEGRDWTETGPRHVLVVEWERPGMPPRVERVRVHTRALKEVEVDVTGRGDQEEIQQAIEAACAPEILWRIVLTGEPEVAPRPRQMEATLAARYGHLQVLDRTTLFSSHILAERLEEETVRGEFFRRLVESGKAAADARERAVVERAVKLGLKVFG